MSTVKYYKCANFASEIYYAQTPYNMHRYNQVYRCWVQLDAYASHILIRYYLRSASKLELATKGIPCLTLGRI